MNGKTFLALALLVSLLTSPLPATVVMFENVKLPAASEMDGLQAVKDYGDHVSSVSSGVLACAAVSGVGPVLACEAPLGGEHRHRVLGHRWESYSGLRR